MTDPGDYWLTVQIPNYSPAQTVGQWTGSAWQVSPEWSSANILSVGAEIDPPAANTGEDGFWWVMIGQDFDASWQPALRFKSVWHVLDGKKHGDVSVQNIGPFIAPFSPPSMGSPPSESGGLLGWWWIQVQYDNSWQAALWTRSNWQLLDGSTVDDGNVQFIGPFIGLDEAGP